MGLLMMPAAGALKSWVNINSVTPIAANNWWTVCVFNVSDFDQKVDPASGKKLNQFHFYPFGKQIDPKTIQDGEAMYIGDIEFWTGYPEVYKEQIASAEAKYNEDNVAIAAKAAEEAFKKYEGIDMTKAPLFTIPGDHSRTSYPENSVTLESVTEDID